MVNGKAECPSCANVQSLEDDEPRRICTIGDECIIPVAHIRALVEKQRTLDCDIANVRRRLNDQVLFNAARNALEPSWTWWAMCVGFGIASGVCSAVLLAALLWMAGAAK